MRDVTAQMIDYAVARATVWNTFFRRRLTKANRYDVLKDFQEVDRLMLRSVIRRDIPEVALPTDFAMGQSAVEGLQLVPIEPRGSLDILVSEEKGGFSNLSWQRGTRIEPAAQIQIDFVEYFDWVQLGLQTNSLCRGRIVSFGSAPQLVAHDVLIETSSVAFRV